MMYSLFTEQIPYLSGYYVRNFVLEKKGKSILGLVRELGKEFLPVKSTCDHRDYHN